MNQIREKYNLEDEHFYLMDRDEFPINGGLFNDKVRYGSFMEELTGRKEIPLGYINHIIMKDGKLISFAPYLEKDKLQTVK